MNTMKRPPFDIYRGDGKRGTYQRDETTVHGSLFKEQGKYLADPELAEAVNVALAVGQPLLLTGEPGCGKTRLAWSVAHELGLEEPLTFHTRSTSQAQDLLYTFDAVRRFYDIQITHPRAADPVNYVRYGPLGQAIVENTMRVVLIDEIDKAPRDFPNDMLNEMDRMEFKVHELEDPQEQLKKSSERPMVIITSNSERQLPLPFLRRCVFYHIRFPEREKLVEIIRERLGHLDLDGQLLEAAVDRFIEVRTIQGLVKPPATGELLAWMMAMVIKRVAAGEVRQARLAALPLWPALIKDRDDYGKLRQAV